MYYSAKVIRRYSSAGTIDTNATLVYLTGTDTAYTLPDPSGLPDGHRMVIKAGATTAFKINNASGFNNGGSDADYANFAGSNETDFLEVIAIGEKWYTLGSSGVTIAGT